MQISPNCRETKTMEVKEAPASAEAASFPTEIENREDTDKEKSEVGQSKQRGRPRKRNHCPTYRGRSQYERCGLLKKIRVVRR